jgi:hypothetical protein
LHATAALDPAGDRLNPEPTSVQGSMGPLLRAWLLLAAWFLGWPADRPLGQRERQQAPVLHQPPPDWPGRGGRGGHPLVMDAAAGGRPEQEEREPRMDQEDGLSRVVCLLAPLTRGLCHRVVGADDPPCRAGRGTRGAAGAAAGPVATSMSASRGAPMGLPPPPSRCTAGPGPSARAQGHRQGRGGPPAARAGGRAAMGWLCLGPCRTNVPGPLRGRRSAETGGGSTAERRGSAGGRS